MRILTPCLLIAFTCLALSVSVSSVAQAEEKAKKKPDPAKMFEKKDANGDGSLTLDEFKKGMKEKQLEFAEKRFKRLDADGDGKPNPNGIADGTHSVANYLKNYRGYGSGWDLGSKASPRNKNWRALLAYNRHPNYARAVSEIAEGIRL